MPLRRTLPTGALALLLGSLACEPSVPQQNPPASVVIALFDPTKSELPLPSDLLLQDPSSLQVSDAQKELLTAFQQQHGFSNDQEVPVTVDFTRTLINADGSVTRAAPTIDTATFTPSTFFVYGITAAGAGEVPVDPIKPGDYVIPSGGDHGTLTLHHKGRQPWAPGRYMVLVRGGGNGVHTTEGDAVVASQIFFLVAQDQDLTSPQNIGLLQAQTGSLAAAQAAAKQLNGVIALYQPAFDAADARFPHQELAAATIFTIAPAATQVQLDPSRGLVPLPIDLLRDPRPGGKLTPLAACTLAGAKLDATGVCKDSQGNVSGAAAGFATLDGFSTTGAILAPTSELLLASTINASTVFLYDLSNPAAPVQVDPASYITEPCEFTSACGGSLPALTPVIGLQPAGATSGDPLSVFNSRPLKDNTDYAVVISDGVQDKAGNSLAPGTAGRILLFQSALVDGTGKSQLAGVDDQTAGALEVMRKRLGPVLAKVSADKSVSKAHVAMAYTFHTQTILSTAARLGALPYLQDPATAKPGDVTPMTATAAFTKYGLNQNIPNDKIAEILETTITTFNLLDPATGAFKADPTKAAAETINVLIAVPKVGGGAPTMAPMIIFRHGLGRGRADMLAIANTYAASGMVAVAIDAAKHGDRSFCTPGVPGTCSVGTCKTSLPAGAQGDAAPPGLCVKDDGTPGAFTKAPVGCGVPPAPGAQACNDNHTDGIPLVSGNYLVSANFFRTRDTNRQDIIDQSQLIRAIVLSSATAPPPGLHKVFDRLLGTDNVIMDPTKIYYSGQSLGAIQGAMDVAANPRISKAVLNVGGGTQVDLLLNSPAFVSSVNQLLAGLGITRGTASYLQFLVVAKTVLDPAEPVNYAGHLTKNTLPNLLPPLGGATDGSVPQAAKKILTQAAFCDQVVPNPFNFILDSTIGTGPRLIDPNFGAPGNFQLFWTGTAAPSPADFRSCPAPPASSPLPSFKVTHGFLIDWVNPNMTAKAQADAAAFVVADTLPNSLVVIPAP